MPQPTEIEIYLFTLFVNPLGFLSINANSRLEDNIDFFITTGKHDESEHIFAYKKIQI